LRPLAYPQSQQLVFVTESISAFADQSPTLPVCARHFIEWRQRCSSFENLSLIGGNSMTMTGREGPEQLQALQVSANLFETLRVQPAMGRLFAAEDEKGSGRIAVLSDELRRREFGATPSILGESITLDNEVYTIIGVLPAAFQFPNFSSWDVAQRGISAQPAIFLLKVFTAREQNELMDNFGFRVVGRLKEGVTREQATADLNVVQAQIMDIAGLKDFELRAMVEPLKEVLVQKSRRGLLVILGAIGTLLLIACLNLSILSLARADRREAESAVRAALGATRAQLLRQALVEAVLVALLGSGLGVAVAERGLDVLARIAPTDLPRLSEVSIDTRVLAFALGLTGVTALLFGALPALRMAGAHAEGALNAGRRTTTTGPVGLRLRSGLVASEVGLGVILLVGAGLLLDSFARVIRADFGFQAPTVLAANIRLAPAKRDQAVGFHDRLLEHLASATGVDSAAIVNALPLEGEDWLGALSVPGDPRPQWDCPLANMRVVSPGYFQTMGIPLLEGRTFDMADRSGGDNDQPRRVVMISQRLARALWPQQDTIVGRNVVVDGQEWEVIGVANDVCARPDHEAAPILYRPYWLGDLPRVIIVARTRGDPLAIAGSVRAAVHSVDADVPITAMRTMREVLEESVSQRRFQMLLTSTFALCALLLAGLGIYGVVAYSVARRTREIGIRAAFGAHPLDLCVMVLRQGMTPVVVGLIFGVTGALACGRLLQSLLYGVKAHDPWIISAVVAAVLLTATLACYVPARRAARIDPMVALRYE